MGTGERPDAESTLAGTLSRPLSRLHGNTNHSRSSQDSGVVFSMWIVTETLTANFFHAPANSALFYSLFPDGFIQNRIEINSEPLPFFTARGH